MSHLDSRRLENIKTWQQRYVDEQKFPGSSVLIRHRGEEVFFNAVGQRNIEQNLPFDRGTTARIYSMTKPITSLALMMLVERGLVHLDTRLSDILPAFENMHALRPGATRLEDTEPCETPTLHQMLTHTAGFSYGFNPGLLPEAMTDQGIGFTPSQPSLAHVVDRLSQLPLAFHPGTRWEYSVSLDIIGHVVECISDQSLDDFFAEHIFEPLGMTHTSFRVPTGTGDAFAALYSPLAGDAMALGSAPSKTDPLRLVDTHDQSPFLSTTTFSGGGGLVGTLDDYMAFTEMLRRGGDTGAGRLVSSSTLDFMLSNHLPGDIASMGPQSFAEQPMNGMGFGIGGAVVLNPALSRVPGSVGDFSWGGMASTFFWVDRVRDLSVVFFTQLSPSSSYPARAELKALVHSALND